MSAAVSLTPGVVTGVIPADTVETHQEWPLDVEKVPIPTWDTGVFITELANLQRLPSKFTNLSEDEKLNLAANPETLGDKSRGQVQEPLDEGTYRGTQLALTKVYDLIEKSYGSFMDTVNFEPSLPTLLSIEKKRQFFQFSDPATDGYPPHLNLGAPDKGVPDPNKEWSEMNPGALQRSNLNLGDIFNKMRLAQLPSLVPQLIPKTFLGKAISTAADGVSFVAFGSMGRPDEGQTIADIEQYNASMRARSGSIFARRDIFDLPNIADLSDWWSDARFAQQQFTGTNPATIEVATDFWIQQFIDAPSKSSSDQAMKDRIQSIASTDKGSLYMQDYSYYRSYAGIKADETIQSPYQFTYKSGLGTKTEERLRYGVAPVCLFHLPKEGQLEPLAIVLDWRGSSEASVFIWNKALTKSEQKVDWPWRYAKTCVQSADWVRHEVVSHLTLTHMVEEATIVGAQRAFQDTHPVFQLLYPHWQKTLSLNAAARATLVPYVINELVGFTTEQSKQFSYEEYKKFDFTGRYVPVDLKRRGFDPAQRNDPRYINYVYARCIYSIWTKIRTFVKSMLQIHYVRDNIDPNQAVSADASIQDWCKIMQADAGASNGGANLKSFPSITTFEGLVDAVTMCIHLASPQHTAVNYLQNYYQAFVANRPPSLYRPPPKTRAELDNFDEQHLVDSLPMNHPREWLLSSHIPYLLSFKPGDKESLIIYAASKYHLYKKKPGAENEAVKSAAAKFYADLASTEKEFAQYAEDTWDSADIKYNVLSPEWNAVSILI